MRLGGFALIFIGPCFAQSPPKPSPSVILTWEASPTKGVTYYPYRASGQCGAEGQVFERLTPSPISALTYLDPLVQRGRKYCYHVTATDGKTESAPGPAAEAVIPPKATP